LNRSVVAYGDNTRRTRRGVVGIVVPGLVGLLAPSGLGARKSQRHAVATPPTGPTTLASRPDPSVPAIEFDVAASGTAPGNMRSATTAGRCSRGMRGRCSDPTAATSSSTADLTSVGGAKEARLVEGFVQELELPSGKVIFEWHSFGDSGD
jgi:hypothetical protein